MTATLVTPTYARDFERFAFLRESIERCAIDLPHLAIVDTEALAQFRNLLHKKNLTLVSSAEILGSAMDRRRQCFGISRRDYRYWITGKGVHGWMAQQLMKLAAARVVTSDAMICLDSDTFFVGRVTADDFKTQDGRVHLYETTDDLDVEMAEWYAHSLRFLGMKEVGIPLRRFTHSPVPMCTQVVRDMQAHIENAHGMNWMEAMIRAERITEYTTYGTYARHVDSCRRTAPVLPALTLYYWWKTEGARLAEDFDVRVAQAKPKMILINSNIGIPVEQYRQLASRAWPGARAQVTA
ncbi:MAG TPA: DUF6492 family protein [Phycisphaerae bacterium]|nr:DUF6492 family protein [Phycisphaerae bacterium]